MGDFFDKISAPKKAERKADAEISTEIPLAVLSQGTRASLEYIQSGVRSVNLRSHRVAMDADPAKPLKDGEERADVEANAIASYLIEKMWPYVMSRSSLMQGKGGAIETAFAQSEAQGFDKLDTLGVETLSRSAHIWLHGKSDDPKIEAAKERLAALVQKVRYSVYGHRPEQFISAGLGTASEITCTLLGAIAPLYKLTYDGSIDKHSYREIAGSARSLVTYLSTLQVSLIVEISQILRASHPIAKPGQFALLERNGKLVLEFSETMLDTLADAFLRKVSVGKRNGVETVRTGCPALFAKGAEKGSVITELFDWYLELVERHYVSRLPEAVSRDSGLHP